MKKTRYDQEIDLLVRHRRTEARWEMLCKVAPFLAIGATIAWFMWGAW